MAKTKNIEIVNVELNGRGIVDVSRILKERCKQLTGSEDLNSLDLGFELGENFLSLGGPQPSLAELTVLATKLKMQIRITHIELDVIRDDADESK